MATLPASAAAEVAAAAAQSTATGASGVWWDRRPTNPAAHCKAEIEAATGRDRLACEVHAIGAAEGESLLASGRTDAFDTPEILRKHAIPASDVRVVHTGAAHFDGPADPAIEPGADLRLRLDGELVADTAAGPRRVDAPFLASVIFGLSAGSSIGRVSGL